MTIQLLLVVLLGLSLLIFVFTKKNNLSLSIRILIGLVLGVVMGVMLKFSPDNLFHFYLTEFLRLLGSGYLLLLKMLVIPLIVTSILNTMLNIGGTNMGDIKKISLTAVGMLLALTAVGALVGIGTGLFMHVGEGLKIPELITSTPPSVANLADILLNIIPDNPVASMSKGNMLAVVVFSILLGYAGRTLDKDESKQIDVIKQFITGFFVIVKKLTHIIIDLTPYGIFGSITLLLASQGLSVLVSMLNYFAAMHVAMFIMLIIHSCLLWSHGIHPIQYFKNAGLALFVAFTTRSSFGTLPVSEEILRERFKLQPPIPAVVPSIGATIGMNACAGIYPAMLVVLAMTVSHQAITWQLALMVAMINMLASLGVSGIPGAASIAAGVTLSSLGLPYAVLAFVQGVDPILDMGRTAVNVNATLTTALITQKYSEAKESPAVSMQEI